MNIRYIIFATSLLAGISKAGAQVREAPELELLRHIQNRITVNHDDGAKEMFTVTDKGTRARSHKLYSWYHSQRVHQTQGGYSGKLLDGTYALYYPDKQLAKQGTYKKGLAHGNWKTWRENSRLEKEERWKKGRQNGDASYYNEQGQLLQHGQMKDGAWDGRVWTFTPADSSYQWHYFHEGQPITHEQYVDSNLFRRTGRFLQNVWSSVFRKAEKPAPEIIP